MEGKIGLILIGMLGLEPTTIRRKLPARRCPRCLITSRRPIRPIGRRGWRTQKSWFAEIIAIPWGWWRQSIPSPSHRAIYSIHPIRPADAQWARERHIGRRPTRADERRPGLFASPT